MIETVKSNEILIVLNKMYIKIVQTDSLNILINSKLIKKFKHAQLIKFVANQNTVHLFLTQSKLIKVVEINADGTIRTFTQDEK